MKEYRLIEAENGGWIVLSSSSAGREYVVSAPVAAFTNAEDALAGMAVLMKKEEKP